MAHFIMKRPPQPLRLLLNLYLCCSTRLIWRSESFTWLKVLHIHESYRMPLTLCGKSNKSPLHLEAHNNPGTCQSPRALHPSCGASLPLELVTTPARPFLQAWALLHGPFPPMQSLLWHWNSCQMTLACSAHRSRCSMTHAGLSDTSYGLQRGN